MSDSDSDEWVAPPPSKGKRKAKSTDAGAGSSRGGGAGRIGDGKAPRKSAPKGGFGGAGVDSPQSCVRLLSRASLEKLLLRLIVDQEMVTAADVRALLPSVLPGPTRPRPRIDVEPDETSNKLGRFSRIPQTIIVGVLVRVPMLKMLSFIITVCKGLRALRTEPMLFRSLTIENFEMSPRGALRLLDLIPGKGEQITHLRIDQDKMDSKDWIAILKRCPNLEALSLDGKKIGTQVVKALQKSCEHITWLSLPKQITHNCLADMWPLLKSKQLRVLKLQHFGISQRTFEKLVATLTEARGGIPLLEELHCSSYSSGMHWKVFSTLDTLPELKKLTIEELDPSSAYRHEAEDIALRSDVFQPAPDMVFKPMLRMELVKIMKIGSTYGPPYETLKTEALSFFLEKLLAAIPNIKILTILAGRFNCSSKKVRHVPYPAQPDLNGVLTRSPPLLHLEDLELGDMNVTLEDFASPFSAPKLRILKLRNCGPHAPAAAQAFNEDKLERFGKGSRSCFGLCGCRTTICAHATFVHPASRSEELMKHPNRFARDEMETPAFDF